MDASALGGGCREKSRLRERRQEGRAEGRGARSRRRGDARVRDRGRLPSQRADPKQRRRLALAARWQGSALVSGARRWPSISRSSVTEGHLTSAREPSVDSGVHRRSEGTGQIVALHRPEGCRVSRAGVPRMPSCAAVRSPSRGTILVQFSTQNRTTGKKSTNSPESPANSASYPLLDNDRIAA